MYSVFQTHLCEGKITFTTLCNIVLLRVASLVKLSLLHLNPATVTVATNQREDHYSHSKIFPNFNLWLPLFSLSFVLCLAPFCMLIFYYEVTNERFASHLTVSNPSAMVNKNADCKTVAL